MLLIELLPLVLEHTPDTPIDVLKAMCSNVKLTASDRDIVKNTIGHL